MVAKELEEKKAKLDSLRQDNDAKSR